MRTLAILLLGAAVAAALPMEKALNDEVPVDGWFVPQLDGSMKWQSEEEFQMEMRDAARETKSTPLVEFYLYTTSNLDDAYQITIDDAVSLSSSPFNNSHPTRFIIHGWQNNYLSDVNIVIRSALLDTGEYNVISVDWSSYSDTLNYPSSVLQVPGVGRRVADMIDFLSTSGELSLGNLKVIGHSLGAHISGYAGKYIVSGQIHSIIGLDPALPGFIYDRCNQRLCETDAYYVESIQTDGGALGFLRPIGKAAFYPNGGQSQPGCGLDVVGRCAHSRSFIYYAEAIRRDNFPSIMCADYLNAISNTCGNIYSTSVRLGAASNVNVAEGIFYTPVNGRTPFGRG